MVHKRIPAKSLQLPLSLERPVHEARKEVPSEEDKAIEAVLSSIYSAKSPVVLVDSLVLQFGLRMIVRTLLADLKFPTFCPFMGKSIIEESMPYFYGTYNGKYSYPGIREAVEDQSDLVIHIGPLPTDMNTGGFSAKIDEEKLILIEETCVRYMGKVFEGVYLKSCKPTVIAAFLLSIS